MNQHIEDWAIGYYNDDRVEAIRGLEKSEILSDCKAADFIIDYGKVLPESVRRWKERLGHHTCLDKEEMTRLAADLRDANPIGWTDEQARDVLARRLLDMEKRARNYTERELMREMVSRCHPDVVERMDEMRIQDAADDKWFSEFIDKAMLSEAGQAPSY